MLHKVVRFGEASSRSSAIHGASIFQPGGSPLGGSGSKRVLCIHLPEDPCFYSALSVPLVGISYPVGVKKEDEIEELFFTADVSKKASRKARRAYIVSERKPRKQHNFCHCPVRDGLSPK